MAAAARLVSSSNFTRSSMNKRRTFGSSSRSAVRRSGETFGAGPPDHRIASRIRVAARNLINGSGFDIALREQRRQCRGRGLDPFQGLARIDALIEVALPSSISATAPSRPPPVWPRP